MGEARQSREGTLVLAKLLILPKLPCAACTRRPPERLGVPTVTLLLVYLNAGDRGGVSSHTHTHRDPKQPCQGVLLVVTHKDVL